MASVEITSTSSVIDSALGPFVVESRAIQGFDIEEHVRTTIESQAIYLQMREKIRTVDPQYTKNRTPVIVGDTAVGGFSA